ncbi:flagellar hook-associated protein 2 [Bacillus litorisediminis]|uniref:flagellar hook-associated protein 2 n=1 Tax=Bacillus litorisediminis TaxID=2922713 RepID=UPI0028BDE62F|nr:flagellar hook-associated protein 2 [Bacillus litorisediminis]
MNMRIGGLASGMDIDQLVKDLMKAERMPLDKLTQRKTYLEWQRDDYRAMNKLLQELDDLIFNGIGRQASFIQKTVSSSNPDAVSIRNINSVTDFSGSLQVHQIAKAASMYSKQAVNIDPNKPLSNYVTGTQKIRIQAIDENGKLEDTAEEWYELEFNPSDYTLNSLLKKINNESGVNTFFDPVTQRVSITAKNTGNIENPNVSYEPSEIVLTDLTGNFLQGTLALDWKNAIAADNGVGTHGVNASFTYNGLTTTRSTNTFQINGFELTLKKPTAAGEEITFSSAPDVDKIVDTIVKFVDKYNEVIEKIHAETNEKKFRDYPPLTDEQKEAMEEKEIELWEERARSGTLYRDSILEGGLTQMRQALSNPVSGLLSFDQLSEIGITTTSNYLDNGKLTIDEDKLREAISKDPNAVYQLFNKDGSSSSTQGIADRLRDSIKNTIQSIEEKAGKATSTNKMFSIGKTLDDLDDRISDFERRLIEIEDRYWRQFSVMEQAIQRTNQQTMFLMNQFGGGSY